MTQATKASIPSGDGLEPDGLEQVERVLPAGQVGVNHRLGLTCFAVALPESGALHRHFCVLIAMRQKTGGAATALAIGEDGKQSTSSWSL